MQSTNEEYDDDIESGIDHNVESYIQNWYPREILRRTNWLYRVDSLRMHDVREMNIMWELACLFKYYATQFLLWSFLLAKKMRQTINDSIKQTVKKAWKITTSMVMFLLSEAYCYFLDFIEIAYYPETNRMNSGNRYPPIKFTTINEMSMHECREMTGFSKPQLRKLLIHLRIPQVLSYPNYYTFSGEEAFIYYMYWNRVGGTKLQMSTNKFGGDPRRFTYAIRLVTNHIYKTFYHKISGDSMRMWIPSINDFKYAIWHHLKHTVTLEEDREGQRYVALNIPLECFRIFGFLDDTGFRTTAPGIGVRRQEGFLDDIQRAFYSAYFAAHGIKVQVISLPNGMIGSIFLASWRNSDAGVANMSGLNSYLEHLFEEYDSRFNLRTVDRQLPSVYGDGIFGQRTTITARLRNDTTGINRRINSIMSAARQSIEHLFSLHHNIFALFNCAERFRLLVSRDEVTKLMFNSFLLLNCYNCFNESSSNFMLRPPTIEEYLPLNEILSPAPEVNDTELGELYNYSARVHD